MYIVGQLIVEKQLTAQSPDKSLKLVYEHNSSLLNAKNKIKIKQYKSHDKYV